MQLVLTDRPLPALPARPGLDVIDLSKLTIAPCVGCFGCWTRTPGRCVIRDDAVRVYPKIAAAPPGAVRQPPVLRRLRPAHANHEHSKTAAAFFLTAFETLL